MITDEGLTIAQALTDGTAVAVSDGSLKNGLGTAAFTIESSTYENRVHGVNKVPGPIGDGDSYRCELAGLYSIVVIVTTIARYYHLPHGKCTIACDNESSLKVFLPDFCPNPKGASYDLVSAIWNILQESPIEWSAVHVKGHQDIKGRNLTRLEKMNVQMDNKAKEYWRYLVKDPKELMHPTCHDIYAEGWVLWCGDEKIVQPSRNQLYELMQDPITIDWWVRHERFSAVAADLIDWHENKKSLKSTPLGIRRWATKHASHNCGCGQTLVKWKKQDDDRCPRCGETEDTDHAIKCTARGAEELWRESIKTIETALEKLQTDPAIGRIILLHIQAWRKDMVVRVDEGERRMCDAVAEQNIIGWRNLMEGLWSKKWRRLQQRYYNKIESRKTGKKWMETISRTIRLAAFKQWDHRNTVKHWKERPRHKEAEQELDREITAELMKGPQNLPTIDRKQFKYGCIQLLQKPVRFKQTWVVNVTTARQRELRKRTNDDNLETVSRKRSKLFQWIESGRAT